MISTEQALALRREAKAIQEEWERGAAPDARAELDRRPELREDKSVALDLITDEYCLRCEAGETPDPEAFCDRFPTFRLSVRRMIATHQYIAEEAGALAGAPAVRWPEPGQRVGDWMLLRELGRGAFARVFLALEESTGDRPVAVKISPEGAAEARTMGRLAHPNIVPILSVRFEDEVGLTVVCMPFLGAATLTDVMDLAYPTPFDAPPREAAVIGKAIRSAARSDDPPPLATGWARRPGRGAYADALAHLALQVADALALLHKEGVVHRDLKPSNVLLRPDGQALLLDFNLSADARAAGARIGGTLPYMAPEQLRALIKEEPGCALDGRMDLFALGVMLYELLTGKLPFGSPPPGQPPAEAAQALLERQPKGCAPLRTLNPAVDRDFARLVESCLALDPSDRPASSADLAAGLRRCLAWPARLRRWTVRRPLIAAAAAGLLLLAVAGAASELAPQPAADVRDYGRGRAAYLDGDYDRAEEWFNQAVQDAPADQKPRKYYMARAAAAMRLAEAGGDNGRLTTALADLDQARQQQSDGPTLALMGYCDGRAGNHKSAILWYGKAIEAGFQSGALFNDRGYSYLQVPNFDAAAPDIDAALRLEPNLQAAIVNRGLVIVRQRNQPHPPALTDALLADLKRAVNAAPGSPDLYLPAARVFATSAQDGTASDPKVCVELTLACVLKAVDGGADPKAISKNPLLSAVLQSFPEFRALSDAQPRPAPPSLPLPLVDPAPYVPE